MTSLPFISCVCLAYGNVVRLQEALACFLNQDYAGQRELLILNSFPKQTLKGEFPNVRIINLPTRPGSLGACRNYAITSAKGTVVAVWDSDDLWLPHHLTTIGEAFAESKADFVRLNPVFYAEGWKIKKTFSTWINAVSFTKEAWIKAGRYPYTLSVGEDQALWGKLSEVCRGVTLELAPQEISVIYCWGTQTFHISGHGWDKKGQTSAYERARLDMEQRVRNGGEPIGDIVLQPKLTHDPVAMARAFLPAVDVRSTAKSDDVCIVELGRYGDIVNILPIARHIAETYAVPHLMVSKDFASICDGVSYVQPHVVDLRNDQLGKAVAMARKEYRHVIVTQIWGTGWKQERKTASFNRESWRMAGFLPQFDSNGPLWRPQFDLRDAKRERGTVEKAIALGKPIILANVTHSASSPFPQGEELLRKISERFDRDYTIVDAGSLRLHRIYDMLALIEEAAIVVSVDTALLHLAAGTNTPIVALVNDKPWQGSEIRGGHCVDRIPYGEATNERVLAAIKMGAKTIATHVPFRPVASPPKRTIFHVVERHPETDQKTESRKRKAWKSWDLLYASMAMVPCHLWEPYPRNAKDAIGDPRPLPYLKDVMEVGMNQAGDDDIILFTNDDNVLHPQVVDMVRLHCAIWGCVCSQRCEFKAQPMPPLTASPQQFAAASQMHMGRDLFAFTKRWLVAHWDEIPDFILGASDWDLMMACMIRLQWGIESDRKNLEDCIWPADMERGYISHQFHAARWAQPDNHWNAPSQKWNRSLFKAWAGLHLPRLQFLAGDVI